MDYDQGQDHGQYQILLSLSRQYNDARDSKRATHWTEEVLRQYRATILDQW